MPDPALDVDDHLTRIELVPPSVQVLGRGPKLDDEIAGKILRLDLTAFLPPQPHQGDLIAAHNGPRVGTTDEGAAVLLPLFPHGIFHAFPPR